MKAGVFDYVRPATLEDAIGILGTNQDAKAIAGGQSLLPLINLRLAQPSILVDIDRLPELAKIEIGEDDIVLGALTRHATLATDPLLQREAPLLADAARLIGYPAIRNRGTLGGSLAHADPVAELPSALLALGGEVVAAGPSGQRTIPASCLFTSYFTTVLSEDELITHVRVPRAHAGDGFAFREFTPSAVGFPLVAVSVALHRERGRCAWVRAAVAGIAATPLSLSMVEGTDEDLSSEATVERICRAALASVEPPSDTNASSEYRFELTSILLADCLRAAWVTATADGRQNG